MDFLSRDKELAMIPIVKRLQQMPQLTDEYAHYSVTAREWQEALESFLLDARDNGVELPADLIADVRAISEELLPKSMRARELVAA